MSLRHTAHALHGSCLHGMMACMCEYGAGGMCFEGPDTPDVLQRGHCIVSPPVEDWDRHLLSKSCLLSYACEKHSPLLLRCGVPLTPVCWD